MHPNDFLKQLDDEKIVAAIAEAERKTSGEIRVYISHKPCSDALTRARGRFRKLGMHKTKHRNAVLLYLAPRSRTFAIVGDTAVHEKCGDSFWQQLSAHLTADIQKLPMTEAIIRSVKTIGELLGQHFPATRDDKNELPNKIERD